MIDQENGLNPHEWVDLSLHLNYKQISLWRTHE